MTTQRFFLLVIAFISLVLSGCSTSPTGRKQLKLYSSSQIDQQGVMAFDQIKGKQKVSHNPKYNRYVQCVANAITPYVSKSVFNGKWEVVVFDSKQVNAFALPGGKIGVYTGLLKVAKNQDQLAAVIGHEVGHVIAEHGNERVSNNALVGIGLQVADVALKANDVKQSNAIMSALGVGSQVAVTLPFSRIQETEADEIGLNLMAKAGFNPQQSVELWKNMQKASGGKRSLEILSTHPAPESRIKDLQKHMDKALLLRSKASAEPSCRI
ncbi:M48 family peptidase [Parashewanella curva]|uniref:M48 family peptidase n=1 Tax=Parashewanella curva TaxID=2338552 RepID=A0A3L8Q0G5_9GAMM|nr:M48 family metallopeptidase [Parashewanella curva]RLV61124.1 M48 family peptidase [Parashewanella curva]